MAARRREVAVRNNVIGILQGETFSPESNFAIKEIINFVQLKDGSGFLVKITSTLSANERYIYSYFVTVTHCWSLIFYKLTGNINVRPCMDRLSMTYILRK